MWTVRSNLINGGDLIGGWDGEGSWMERDEILAIGSCGFDGLDLIGGCDDGGMKIKCYQILIVGSFGFNG